jgi:uncharacterized protein (TIGR03000 family)
MSKSARLGIVALTAMGLIALIPGLAPGAGRSGGGNSGGGHGGGSSGRGGGSSVVNVRGGRANNSNRFNNFNNGRFNGRGVGFGFGGPFFGFGGYYGNPFNPIIIPEPYTVAPPPFLPFFPAVPDAPMGGPGTIIFTVPDNALVWVDGQPLAALGPDRTFNTPPIPPGGTEIHSIRVSWNQNGKEQNYERKISVRAGGKSSVTIYAPTKNLVDAGSPN